MQVLATLNYASDCAAGSDVSNYNNGLKCGVSNVALPPGSWSASCASATWDPVHGMLSAVCAPSKSPATLDFYLCAPGTTIWNDHGFMRCNSYILSIPGELL